MAVISTSLSLSIGYIRLVPSQYAYLMNVVSYETNISPGQQQGRAAHGGTTLRASIMQGDAARQRYRAAVIEHFGQCSEALNNEISIGGVFTFLHISTAAIKWFV